jgi:hypothetical protein
LALVTEGEWVISFFGVGFSHVGGAKFAKGDFGVLLPYYLKNDCFLTGSDSR